MSRADTLPSVRQRGRCETLGLYPVPWCGYGLLMCVFHPSASPATFSCMIILNHCLYGRILGLWAPLAPGCRSERLCLESHSPA